MRYKWELMKRDPLGLECVRLFPPHVSVSSLADAPLDARVQAFLKLQEKYHVRLTPIWELVTSKTDNPFQSLESVRTLAGGREVASFPFGFEEPIRYGTNFGFPPEVTAGDISKGEPPIIMKPSPPPVLLTPTYPPTLAMAVDLSEICLRDLDRLARRFKDLIRKALDFKTRNEWARKALPEIHPTGPRELAFLRTVSERQFAKDLRRYDLHMVHGLPFRVIGLHERAEKAGRPVPLNRLPRTVGDSVKGESSVRASVNRIFRAIYRRPYAARRRRLDHPALGIQPFTCPDHGQGCNSLACKHLQDWWRRVRPTLPSDKTGLGPSLLGRSRRISPVPTGSRKD